MAALSLARAIRARRPAPAVVSLFTRAALAGGTATLAQASGTARASAAATGCPPSVTGKPGAGPPPAAPGPPPPRAPRRRPAERHRQAGVRPADRCRGLALIVDTRRRAVAQCRPRLDSRSAGGVGVGERSAGA